MIQTLFGSVEPEPGFLDRLKTGVQKTRTGLLSRLEDVLAGKKEIDSDLLEHLEYTLLGADLGVKTTSEILELARQRVDRKLIGDAGELRQVIREHLRDVLKATERALPVVAEPPAVVLVVGVNGSGKTTTIGKLARRYQAEGRAVLLCAADTFRAAAIDQLEIWGRRTGAGVVSQKPGADPSAVVYDALQSAKARKIDCVIVDTAGRLHTKSNLMAELEKMRRTASRLIPGAPHEVLLVMDATTGQNGLEQARRFTESSGVTGIVLTKLDGTAKGGIVVAIARELNLPIRFVGIGEQVDDLLQSVLAGLVNLERQLEKLFDVAPWVQRRPRILKDDLYLFSEMQWPFPVGLEQPIARERFLGLGGAQRTRLGRRRLDVGRDRLAHVGTADDLRADVEHDLEPLGRIARRCIRTLELLQARLDRLGLLPEGEILLGRVRPLLLGKRRVLEQQLQEALGLAHEESILDRDEVIDGACARRLCERPALGREVRREPAAEGIGERPIERDAFLEYRRTRAHQGLRERAAAHVERPERAVQHAHARIERRTAHAMELRHFVGRQRFRV